MMSAFESGDLTFFESDILKVKATQNEIEEIRAALLFDGRINDAFATGVKVCMETNGYNHTRMIENCKKCRASYTQMAKLSDQLVEFERIYNKGYSAKNRLYFSDYMRNRGANVRNYAAPNVTGQYRDANVSTLK